MLLFKCGWCGHITRHTYQHFDVGEAREPVPALAHVLLRGQLVHLILLHEHVAHLHISEDTSYFTYHVAQIHIPDNMYLHTLLSPLFLTPAILSIWRLTWGRPADPPACQGQRQRTCRPPDRIFQPAGGTSRRKPPEPHTAPSLAIGSADMVCNVVPVISHANHRYRRMWFVMANYLSASTNKSLIHSASFGKLT